MDRMFGGILILVLTLSVSAAQDKGGDKSDSPAERYRALVKEFNEAAHANWQATNDEERRQIVARIENLPLRLLELVEERPKDPIALARPDPGGHAGILVGQLQLAPRLGPGQPAGQGDRDSAARSHSKRQARRDGEQAIDTALEKLIKEVEEKGKISPK